MAPLKLTTLNVGLGYYPQSLDFLAERSRTDDVVFVQELLGPDRHHLEALFEHHSCWPLTRVFEQGAWYGSCIGIYSHVPLHAMQAISYAVGDVHTIENLDESSLARRNETTRSILLVAEIEKDGLRYTVGTTYLTWVPTGEPSEFQRANALSLLGQVEQFDELALAGDFNMPRDGEIYRILTGGLTDWVPRTIDNTLDPDIHALKGKISVVADYLFTKKGDGQQVSDVRLTFGVSDHGALSASLSE
jgi:endonuclease/exonuclease/phosphatase family metal-dependent hydrolase